jgi:hypothetical protein
MVCDPSAKVTGRGARPAPSSEAFPKVVAPSWKVTVPAGTPVPGGVAVTAAINVTVGLSVAGLADELTAVLVAAVLTTSAAEFPVLPAHPGAPVKVAVMT